MRRRPIPRQQVRRIVAGRQRLAVGKGSRSAGVDRPPGEGGQVENQHFPGVDRSQRRRCVVHGLFAGRVGIRPKPAITAGQGPPIGLAHGLRPALPADHRVFRQQPRRRVACLLAFHDHRRPLAMRRQLRQAQQRARRGRGLELPGQPAIRETPQGQGGKLLSLAARLKPAMVETHPAARVRVSPARRRLAVSRMGSRRGRRILGNRHQANRLGGARRRFRGLFRGGRYPTINRPAFVPLRAILAVRLGDAVVRSQPFRRLDLSTAQDIRRQGDQIAALVAGCEV